MVLLVGYRCSAHGEVFAPGPHGPCPKCLGKTRRERIEAAQTRVRTAARGDDFMVLRAEVTVLRERLFRTERHPDLEPNYWEQVAEMLEKERVEKTRSKEP